MIPSMQHPVPKDPADSSLMQLRIIGHIRTPYQCVDDIPAQPFRSRAEGRAEILPHYAEGLDGLEDFSHLILLYLFHRVRETKLSKCTGPEGAVRGIFSTRDPARPTPVGMSTVRLIRKRRNVLWLYGVDVLDRTPLIDIKPYVPAFDCREAARIGWMEGKVPNIKP